MINHVVLFKLKEFTEEEKSKVRDELKGLLEGLKSKIDVVKYLEVGVNHELNAKSFDIALNSHFETIEDLDIYRVHPDHKKVLDRIMETTVLRSAVDYYF